MSLEKARWRPVGDQTGSSFIEPREVTCLISGPVGVHDEDMKTAARAGAVRYPVALRRPCRAVAVTVGKARPLCAATR
ncbi:MAG: hypothetical protein MZU79_08755 [Anaerotruncus sp.]|nr:hypothetical protein [Anaerotruncus sp.]